VSVREHDRTGTERAPDSHVCARPLRDAGRLRREDAGGRLAVPAFREDPPAAPRIVSMMIAVIWHYWIAVALVVFAVIPVVAMTAIGYLNKVVRPKYPPRQRSRT
jgi:hypothetical protein